MKKVMILIALAALVFSCAQHGSTTTAAEVPAESEWMVLFDGSSLEG